MEKKITTPDTIDVTNINEKVYSYIRKKIITYYFPSGYKLSIRQLSKTLGVSPTPIKDALFRLAGEGLVDIASRTGTYVKSITETDIHEILCTRLILETAVIERIARKITDEQLEVPKDLYLKSASLVVNPNDIQSYKAFMEYDSEFHLSFFYIMGNRQLINIYKNMNAHMQMVRFRLMNHVTGKLPTTDEEHRLILEAICERSIAKTKLAIENHIHTIDATSTMTDQDRLGQKGGYIKSALSY